MGFDMWGHMSGHGWGSGGMGFGMLLFWGLLIAAVVQLIRRSRDSNSSEERRAIDTLMERYARGEINREEFEQKKRDLEN